MNLTTESKKRKATTRTLSAFLASVLLLSPGGLLAGPLPSGYTVKHGKVNVTANGQTMNIEQLTNKAIVNWKDFSIGQSNVVNVIQKQNLDKAVMLARVVGNNPSNILGQLNVDQSFFLVNPNGVYFGKNARVDVGAMFAASTLNISDADFLNGKYFFQGEGKGTVVNEGVINAASAALLGGKVANAGTINANQAALVASEGSVELANFGHDAKLTLSFGERPATVDTMVVNAGDVNAAEGEVVLFADGGLADNSQGAIVAKDAEISGAFVDLTQLGQVTSDTLLIDPKGTLNIGAASDTKPNWSDGGNTEGNWFNKQNWTQQPSSGTDYIYGITSETLKDLLDGTTGVESNILTLNYDQFNLLDNVVINSTKKRGLHLQTNRTDNNINAPHILIGNNVQFNSLGELILDAQFIYKNEGGSLYAPHASRVTLKADKNIGGPKSYVPVYTPNLVVIGAEGKDFSGYVNGEFRNLEIKGATANAAGKLVLDSLSDVNLNSVSDFANGTLSLTANHINLNGNLTLKDLTLNAAHAIVQAKDAKLVIGKVTTSNPNIGNGRISITAGDDINLAFNELSLVLSGNNNITSTAGDVNLEFEQLANNAWVRLRTDVKAGGDIQILSHGRTAIYGDVEAGGNVTIKTVGKQNNGDPRKYGNDLLLSFSNGTKRNITAGRVDESGHDLTPGSITIEAAGMLSINQQTSNLPALDATDTISILALGVDYTDTDTVLKLRGHLHASNAIDIVSGGNISLEKGNDGTDDFYSFITTGNNGDGLSHINIEAHGAITLDGASVGYGENGSNRPVVAPDNVLLSANGGALTLKANSYILGTNAVLNGNTIAVNEEAYVEADNLTLSASGDLDDDTKAITLWQGDSGEALLISNNLNLNFESDATVDYNFYVGGDITIVAGGALNLAGNNDVNTLYADGSIAIQALDDLTLGAISAETGKIDLASTVGSIEVASIDSNVIDSKFTATEGDITVTAMTGELIADSTFKAGGNVSLTAEDAHLVGSTVIAGGSAEIVAKLLTNNNVAADSLSAAAATTIAGGTYTAAATASLGADVDIDGVTLIAAEASVKAGRDLKNANLSGYSSVNASATGNIAGLTANSAAGKVEVSAQGLVDNANITAASKLELEAGYLLNSNLTGITSAKLEAELLDNTSVITNGELTVAAQNVVGSTFTASGSATFGAEAANIINFVDNTVTVGFNGTGDLTAYVSNDLTGNTLRVDGATTLKAANNVAQNDILAGGALTVTGTAKAQLVENTFATNGALTIDTFALSNANKLTSVGDMTLSDIAYFTNDTLTAGDNGTLTIKGAANVSGLVADANKIDITSTTRVENASLKATTDAKVTAQNIVNTDITARWGKAELTAAEAIANTAVTGNGDATITALQVANSDIISATGKVDLAQANMNLMDTDITAATLTTADALGNVTNGNWTIAGELALKAANVSGLVADANAITITSASNVENAALKATKEATVTAKNVLGSEIVSREVAVTVTADNLKNTGIVAATAATLTATETISGTTVAASTGDVTLSAKVGIADTGVTATGAAKVALTTDGTLTATTVTAANATEITAAAAAIDNLGISSGDKTAATLTAANIADSTVAAGTITVTGKDAEHGQLANTSLNAANRDGNGTITITDFSRMNNVDAAAIKSISGTVTNSIIGGDFIAGNDIALNAKYITLDKADSRGTLNIAGTNSIIGGDYVAGGKATFTTPYLAQVTLLASGDAVVNAATVENANVRGDSIDLNATGNVVGSTIAGATGATITAAQIANSDIISAGQVALNTTGMNLMDTDITAATLTTADKLGNVTNGNWTIAGELALKAANVSGLVADANKIDITSTTRVENASLKATTDAKVTAQNIVNTDVTARWGKAELTAAEAIANTAVTANGDATITALQVANSDIISATGKVNLAQAGMNLMDTDITAATLTTADALGNVTNGNWTIAGELALKAANVSGLVADANAITITSASNVENAALKATKEATVTAKNVLGSEIVSREVAVTVTADNLKNTGIVAATAATLTATETISGTTVAASTGAVTLNAKVGIADTGITATGAAKVALTTEGTLTATTVTAANATEITAAAAAIDNLGISSGDKTAATLTAANIADSTVAAGTITVTGKDAEHGQLANTSLNAANREGNKGTITITNFSRMNNVDAAAIKSISGTVTNSIIGGDFIAGDDIALKAKYITLDKADSRGTLNIEGTNSIIGGDYVAGGKATFTTPYLAQVALLASGDAVVNADTVENANVRGDSIDLNATGNVVGSTIAGATGASIDAAQIANSDIISAGQVALNTTGMNLMDTDITAATLTTADKLGNVTNGNWTIATDLTLKAANVSGLVADASKIDITSTTRVENASLKATTDAKVTAQNIVNTDVTARWGKAELTAAEAIANTAVTANGDATITALQVANSDIISAAGQVALNTTGMNLMDTDITAATLTTADKLGNVTNGNWTIAGELALKAANVSGLVADANKIDITSASNVENAALKATNAATITAKNVLGSEIVSRDAAVTVEATNLKNTGIVAGKTVDLTIADLITGVTATATDGAITVQTAAIADTGLTASNGAIALKGTMSVANSDLTAMGGDITVEKAFMKNSDLYAKGGNVTVNAGSLESTNLNSDGKNVTATVNYINGGEFDGTEVALTANGANHGWIAGATITANDATLTAANALSDTGITALNEAVITAAAMGNTAVTANGDATITAAQVANSDIISATGKVDLAQAGMNLMDTDITAATLTTADKLGNVTNGNWTIAGELALKAANVSGLVADASKIDITSASNVENAALKATQDATITAKNVLGSEIVSRDAAVTVTADNLKNTGIVAGTTVDLTIADLITGVTATATDGAITVQTAAIADTGLTASNGAIALKGTMSVANSDLTAMGGDITVEKAYMKNSDLYAKGGNVTVNAGSLESTNLNSDGKNVTATVNYINGGEFDGTTVALTANGANHGWIAGATITANDATLTAANALSDTGITALNVAVITAAAIGNTKVNAGSNITVTAGAMVGNDLVTTAGNVDITAEQLMQSNSVVTVAADSTVTIASNGTLADNSIKTLKTADITAETLSNNDITASQADGAIVITATTVDGGQLAADSVALTAETIGQTARVSVNGAETITITDFVQAKIDTTNDSDVAINAKEKTGAESLLDLTADTNVALTSTIDGLKATVDGNLDITETDDLTLENVSAKQNLTVTAGNSIAVNAAAAGNAATLTATAGDITDGNADNENTNLTANAVTLTANGNIGGADDLSLAAKEITATATTGSINLHNLSNETAEVKGLTAGENVTFTAAGNGDTDFTGEVKANDGTVAIYAEGTVLAEAAITATENVGIFSKEGDVVATYQAPITAENGEVYLAARKDIALSAAVTANQDIDMETYDGSIFVSGAGSLTSSTRDINFAAGKNVEIAGAVNAADDVTVLAQNYARIDNTVTAGSDISVEAAGRIDVLADLTAGKNAELRAMNDITLAANVTAAETISAITEGGDIIQEANEGTLKAKTITMATLKKGNVVIDDLQAEEMVAINADGSIRRADQDEADITAAEVILAANGAIGQLSFDAEGNVLDDNFIAINGANVVVLDTDANNGIIGVQFSNSADITLTANAEGNDAGIYLSTQDVTALTLEEVIAKDGDVIIGAADTNIIANLVRALDDGDINGYENDGNSVSIEAAGLTIGNGGIQADMDIAIVNHGDIAGTGSEDLVAGNDIALEVGGQIGSSATPVEVDAGGELHVDALPGNDNNGRGAHNIWIHMAGTTGDGDIIHYDGEPGTEPGIIYWNGHIWGGQDVPVRLVDRASGEFMSRINDVLARYQGSYWAVNTTSYFPHVRFAFDQKPADMSIDHILNGKGVIDGLPEGVTPNVIDINSIDETFIWSLEDDTTAQK